MRRWLLLVLCLVTVPANAMTAADLLAAEKRFATGYIFGAVEYQIGIYVDDSFSKRREEIRKCLLGGKFKSDSIYSEVTTFIRSHSETHPNSAIGAILQAVNSLCPQSGRK